MMSMKSARIGDINDDMTGVSTPVGTTLPAPKTLEGTDEYIRQVQQKSDNMTAEQNRLDQVEDMKSEYYGKQTTRESLTKDKVLGKEDEHISELEDMINTKDATKKPNAKVEVTKDDGVGVYTPIWKYQKGSGGYEQTLAQEMDISDDHIRATRDAIIKVRDDKPLSKEDVDSINLYFAKKDKLEKKRQKELEFNNKQNEIKDKANADENGNYYDSNSGDVLDKDGNVLFMGAGDMGVGSLAGGANAMINAQDTNGDGVISQQERVDAFLKGLLYGTSLSGLTRVSIKALKPDLYKKAQDAYYEQFGKNSEVNGMFVGAKPDAMGKYPKGSFSDVASKKAIYEIDDSQIKLKEKAGYPDTNGRLYEYIEHTELFNKYPEAKNIKVRTNSGLGSFIDEDNQIHIDVDSYDITEDFIHELQHYVQAKENWAMGGTPRGRGGYNRYYKLWGEQQARAAEYRKDMTPEQKANETWQETLERVEGEYEEPILKYGKGKRYHAKELENSYQVNGFVDESKLYNISEKLPKEIKSKDEFKKQFENIDQDGRSEIHLGDLTVKVRVNHAFKHLFSNTNKQNRGRFSGAFAPTVKDPLFVVRDEYDGKDSYVFYRPFKKDDKTVHLAGFFLDSDGEILSETFMNLPTSKINKFIEINEENLEYHKYSNQN